MPRIAWIVAACLILPSAPAAALTLLTEENPPLNFTRDGKPAGTSTAVVQEAAKRARQSAEIRVVPWNEGYAQARSNPDVCLFSTARTPQRYKLFQWVGPINRGVWSLFGRAGFPDRPQRVDELKQYRIGVVADARAAYLRERGFENLVLAERDEQIPAKLVADPSQDGVDLWMTQNSGAAETARKAGVKDVKLVFAGIMAQDYWLACHPQMPEETVKALRAAISGMRKDGTMQKLMAPAAR